MQMTENKSEKTGDKKHGNKNKKKRNVLTKVLIIIGAIAIIIFGTITVLRVIGKHKLLGAVAGTGAGISLNNVEVIDLSPEMPEGAVSYNGITYVPNNDVITILVMGIDQWVVNPEEDDEDENESEDDGVISKTDRNYGGGQADAMFLVIIDPHKKNMSVVAINRNTMTDVDVFDENGDYLGIYTEQIGLQHGYGDGGPQSCERQVYCVSRFFHGITINAYVAIKMDALPLLNDAIGGVTLTAIEDVPLNDRDDCTEFIRAGETVTLTGDLVNSYIKYRTDELNSNALRVARQKQYILSYVSKAKTVMISNPAMAVDLYNTLSEYMVADIDLSTFTYMVTEYGGYTFDSENMYSPEGEAIIGNVFEEFYVSEDSLEELIMKLYFEPW